MRLCPSQRKAPLSGLEKENEARCIVFEVTLKVTLNVIPDC